MLPLFFVLVTIVVTAGSSKDLSCDEYIGKKYFEARCSNLFLKNVPQNLNSRVKLLDLSRNRLTSLNSNSFAPYPKLEELYLQDNNIQSVDADVFSRHTDLLVLDLDYNSLYKLPDFPSSLTTLRLSGSLLALETNTTKFSSLKSLTHLRMQGVGLNKFPELSAIGDSLVELDIRDNPSLIKFGVADLAPLCKLKTLLVGNETEDAIFPMTDDECACRDVREWMLKYAVNGTKIVCPNKHIECHKTDSDDFESIRTKCEWRSRVNVFYKYWIISTIILILVLGVSIFCCIRCRRRRSSLA